MPRITIVPWDGHEALLGCRLEATVVELSPPSKSGFGAVLNHLVVSVTAPPPEGRDTPRCRTDFVVGISTQSPRQQCVPVERGGPPGPPPLNATAWVQFPSLKWPPKVAGLPGATPVVEFVSIELTRLSSVIPFVVPYRRPDVEPFKHSLKPFAEVPPIASGPPPAVLARLDAPLRCDQGLYMGFTNIIESLVSCCVFAVAAKRNHIEFPSGFQQETFLTLFDADRMRAKALEWYGVHITFLDPSYPVVSPAFLPVGLPRMRKEFLDFARSAADRPGVRVHVGDVWLPRLTTLTETQQTRWFAENAFVPNGKLREFSTTLLAEMKQLASNASVTDAVARLSPTVDNSTTMPRWAAVHLRLEEDRTGHGAAAARAGESTLRSIKAQIVAHFRGDEGVPVFYACGPLAPAIRQHIPSNWRHKNDFFDPANWSGMWRGKWINGREYDVTNATGSLVDMFVLLEAPLTIMAEFSSFGEYIAALRCAKELPTLMYTGDGTFNMVDCSLQVMFQRAWHTENRRLGCHRRAERTRMCAEHMKSHLAFKRQVLRLDAAMRDHGKEMYSRRPL